MTGQGEKDQKRTRLRVRKGKEDAAIIPDILGAGGGGGRYRLHSRHWCSVIVAVAGWTRGSGGSGSNRWCGRVVGGADAKEGRWRVGER